MTNRLCEQKSFFSPNRRRGFLLSGGYFALMELTLESIIHVQSGMTALMGVCGSVTHIRLNVMQGVKSAGKKCAALALHVIEFGDLEIQVMWTRCNVARTIFGASRFALQSVRKISAISSIVLVALSKV